MKLTATGIVFPVFTGLPFNEIRKKRIINQKQLQNKTIKIKGRILLCTLCWKRLKGSREAESWIIKIFKILIRFYLNDEKAEGEELIINL